MAEPPERSTTNGGSGYRFQPRPDPSPLTTELTLREVSHLKELVEARLDAMDKAVLILQEDANRSPSINEIYLQHEEKFKTITLQLAAAEKSVETQQEASDRAIAKSEAATTKQIDQLVVIMETSNAACNEKIDDLKGRFAGIDGRDRGLDKGREPLNAIWMVVVAALIAAIISYFATKLGSVPGQG